MTRYPASCLDLYQRREKNTKATVGVTTVRLVAKAGSGRRRIALEVAAGNGEPGWMLMQAVAKAAMELSLRMQETR